MMIYLVRHAWAGQSGDPQYPNDELRPLTDKGRERFRNMARKLVKRGVNPQSVATSSLVRAKETAEILSDQCPVCPPVTVLEDLAPGGRLDPLLNWTREQSVSEVAWVGHAPDIEELATALIGAQRGQIRFEKGAVASIHFAGQISAGAGEMIWLATAGLLRC